MKTTCNKMAVQAEEKKVWAEIPQVTTPQFDKDNPPKLMRVVVNTTTTWAEFVTKLKECALIDSKAERPLSLWMDIYRNMGAVFDFDANDLQDIYADLVKFLKAMKKCNTDDYRDYNYQMYWVEAIQSTIFNLVADKVKEMFYYDGENENGKQ